MLHGLRTLTFLTLCSLVVTPVGALPRTYLQVSGGANVLNTNLSGTVVKERVVGHFELGIGGHLTDNTLLEVSFAVMGKQEDLDARQIFDPQESLLPDTEKAYRVEINPLMMRVRHTRSGMRQGYLKPELSLGVGVYSVTRWIRSFAGIPPASTSQLLPAAELGASMLMIMGSNFMGSLGARYSVMQRRGISQGTEHFDGLSIILGFRFFLNSPRDEMEPDDKD